MDNMNIVMTIIFLFTFIPLVIAEIARKKSKTTAGDFFLCERKLSLPLVFATVYATWVSSFAVIGASSMFYENGPVYMTCFAWNILFGLLFMILGERISFIGQKNDLMTPSDFFYYIFDEKKLGTLVTIILTGFTIPYIMIQLFGGAIIIETVTNGLIPWRMSGFIFYMVIIIYLWSGGLRAVAMTDMFYGALTFITMIATGIILIEKVGGTTVAFKEIYKSDPYFLTLAGEGGIEDVTMWITMFLIVPCGAIMGPAMWIRMYAVGERKTFKIIPFLLGIVTVMYVGTVLYSVSAKLLIPDVIPNDKLIPNLLMQVTNPVTAALLMCGITAASLSTANSQIHALSQILTFDIYRKTVSKHRENLSEHRLLSVGKWSIIVVSALAYLLMIYGSVHIIEIGMVSMGGVAQIIVPVIGVLCWHRSNKNAAFYGLLAGEILVCVGTVLSIENVVYVATAALILNSAVFIIFSLISKTDKGSSEKIKAYKKEYSCYIKDT